MIAIRKGREIGRRRRHRAARRRLRRHRPPDRAARRTAGTTWHTVGTERFRLLRVDDSLPYFQGEIEPLAEEPPAIRRCAARARGHSACRPGSAAYLNALADRGGGVINVADLPDEPCCSPTWSAPR